MFPLDELTGEGARCMIAATVEGEEKPTQVVEFVRSGPFWDPHAIGLLYSVVAEKSCPSEEQRVSTNELFG
jgi:hypothetical protein